MAQRHISWSLAGGSAVLLIAVALVAYGSLRPLPPARFVGPLSAVLPTREEVPGWTLRQESIADSPEMKRAVSELLNFDDAVFMSYLNGPRRISIYVAYWKPGRMSQRLVAGHTPDVCWVMSGWETLESRVAEIVPGRGSEAVMPAEVRRMRRSGVEETVAFWHIVGGRRISYGSGPPPWNAALKEIVANGLDQRQEQVFIRISSPEREEAWSQTEVVQTLFARLRAAGVGI